jgi:RNA polymerase sigma-70 factor (ECF subfamily)
MSASDRAFRDFRVRPGPDTLRALLSAHQSTVYHVSLQVLRRDHDAEDAAQEALLEIASGVRAMREPRAFKRWVCRIALHTALDHLRRRNRRERLEKARATMKPAPPDPAADAVHDALSRLGDDDRCLLVERYFERATLEEIGVREGVSTAAVGKRVDRAKERLKQALAQAGFVPLVPRIDQILDHPRPTGAIPDLISTSPALQSVLALAGSVVMGTKAGILGTLPVVALLMFLIGGGSGYLIGNKRSARLGGETNPRLTKPAPQSMQETEQSPTSHLLATSPDVPAPNGPEEQKELTLAGRLNEFMEWRKRYDSDHEIRFPSDIEVRFRAIQKKLDDLRNEILKNPAEFLAWVSQTAENTTHLVELFEIGLGQLPYNSFKTHSYRDFPPELMEGLLPIIQTGSESARIAAMEFLEMIRNPPDSFRRQYLQLLADTSFSIQIRAARALLWAPDPTSSEVAAVMRCMERLPKDHMDLNLVRRMGSVPGIESRNWLLQLLEAGRIPDGYHTYMALEWWMEPGRVSDPAFHSRAARILSASMQRTISDDAYKMTVFAALNLPSEHSIPILEQAAADAPTLRLREAAAQVLQAYRTQFMGPQAMRDAWKYALKAN